MHVHTHSLFEGSLKFVYEWVVQVSVALMEFQAEMEWTRVG